jgi:hypothetical protein
MNAPKLNSFINEIYQTGDGKTVTGVYRSEPFQGVIAFSRSTYGHDINVYIDLVSPIMIGGRERDRLVIAGTELFAGSSPVARNLHVYL